MIRPGASPQPTLEIQPETSPLSKPSRKSKTRVPSTAPRRCERAAIGCSKRSGLSGLPRARRRDPPRICWSPLATSHLIQIPLGETKTLQDRRQGAGRKIP